MCDHLGLHKLWRQIVWLLAEIADLLVHLVVKDRHVEQGEEDHDGCHRVCLKALEADQSVDLYEMSDGLKQDDCQVDGVHADKHEEVFVILVAETGVDERAVMIKVLDASITDLAVG